MTTIDYPWAEAQLREFIDLIEEAKKLRGGDKGALPRVKQAVPAVRAILQRLDPDLAEFKTGGFAVWDKALDAAHGGIGAIKAATEVEEKMGPPISHADLSNMHPTVAGAARKAFGREEYTEAVGLAAEQVVQEVRARTERSDIVGTAVWQQAFSDKGPEPGKPRLRWPGDPDDVDARGMNEGLRHLGPGLQMTVRNPAAHNSQEPLTRQEAVERLSALSLLAGLVEKCDVIRVFEVSQ